MRTQFPSRLNWSSVTAFSTRKFPMRFGKAGSGIPRRQASRPDRGDRSNVCSPTAVDPELKRTAIASREFESHRSGQVEAAIDGFTSRASFVGGWPAIFRALNAGGRCSIRPINEDNFRSISWIFGSRGLVQGISGASQSSVAVVAPNFIVVSYCFGSSINFSHDFVPCRLESEARRSQKDRAFRRGRRAFPAQSRFTPAHRRPN